MPFSSLEQKTQQVSKAIDELEIELERIQMQSDSLFQELKITPEQLQHFMDNKQSHVSDHDWDTLLEQRKILNEKLEKTLANIRNPENAKKKFSDLHQMHQLRHCLFVR